MNGSGRCVVEDGNGASLELLLEKNVTMLVTSQARIPKIRGSSPSTRSTDVELHLAIKRPLTHLITISP